MSRLSTVRRCFPATIAGMPDHPVRPALHPDLAATEFHRWYWLKEELTDFARELGLRTSGNKDVLTGRILAALAAEPFTEPTRPVSPTAQLSEPLTPTTVIPPGQRCSQILRAWFKAQVGAGFHFDRHMRGFFAAADGTTTLRDALTHWHSTRNCGPEKIGRQFEYNRFTRAWHAANPSGTTEQLLAAWRRYRERPVDERGRI